MIVYFGDVHMCRNCMISEFYLDFMFAHNEILWPREKNCWKDVHQHQKENNKLFSSLPCKLFNSIAENTGDFRRCCHLIQMNWNHFSKSIFNLYSSHSLHHTENSLRLHSWIGYSITVTRNDDAHHLTEQFSKGSWYA